MIDIIRKEKNKMDINQISAIVNSVTNQAMGSTAIAVVDNTSLVALGDLVLSSQEATENWSKSLILQIGRTIISQRRYDRKYQKMLRDDFEWGAILQKIKVDMPEAENDQSYDIAQGGTVDHYKVNKLKVHQKLFYTETPWQLHVSIQREHLKEAFTDMVKMNGFISAKFNEVQNKIEVSLEQLSMNAVNNFIAECTGGTREIKLLTMYNALTGNELTADKAMQDDGFLRFAVKQIKIISDRMTRMTKGVYNDGTTTRHTPYDYQCLYISSEYERSLETVTQYQAFRDKYVTLENYETIPFWQSIQTPNDIEVNRASDSTEKTVNNVLGVLFDIEAIGTYKHEEVAAATPLNAAGLYINYYWHLKDLYFNDLSENGVVFVVA